MESTYIRNSALVIAVLVLLIVVVLNTGFGTDKVISANVISVGEKHFVRGAPLPISIKAITPGYEEVTITIPHNVNIKAGDKIELLEKHKLFSNEKLYTYPLTNHTSLTSSSSGTMNFPRFSGQ